MLHGLALNWAVAMGSTLLAGPQFPRLECINRGEAQRQRHAQTHSVASKEAVQTPEMIIRMIEEWDRFSAEWREI